MEERDRYVVSTDKHRLDIDFVHAFLSQNAYWALGRSRAMVEKSIEHSLCFGLYEASSDGESERQVGFARVVTDYTTFAWLCDVFVDDAVQGHGLGKRLVQAVVSHPELQSLKRILLATRDAHELYRRYGGFETLSTPERWMARVGQSSTGASSISEVMSAPGQHS